MKLIFGEKFKIESKIGEGNNGEVYSGRDIESDEKIAIKLEPIQNYSTHLTNEWKVYQAIGKEAGFADARWFGTEGDYNCLVTDLLGPSLNDLFYCCNKKFTLKTVLILADQLISRIESLHSKSFVHGSLKPVNLVVGLGDSKQCCYMIDFGRTRRFQDPTSRKHIEYFEANNMHRFCGPFYSMNRCLGNEYSRRDDMHSLGCMFIYFLRGNLPWEKDKRITSKRHVSYDELCRGFPVEFKEYLNYVAEMQFEETPDYGLLKTKFKALFDRSGFEDDGMTDWHADGFSMPF